jgi:hypothetical protein
MLRELAINGIGSKPELLVSCDTLLLLIVYERRQRPITKVHGDQNLLENVYILYI